MDGLTDFGKELESLIGRPTNLRPFVCDGSPLDCQVFIVGFNPATSMTADFWDFWHHSPGFDKAAWFAAYKGERRTRPLKPGKTRRNPVSNTRRVLDWVAESAAPLRCLETNIHAAPSEQAADLASRLRITAPFDFLLARIRPKVVVTHGAEAEAHIRGMSIPAQLISVPHFSRGWSAQASHQLGLQIRAACRVES